MAVTGFLCCKNACDIIATIKWTDQSNAGLFNQQHSTLLAFVEGIQQWKWTISTQNLLKKNNINSKWQGLVVWYKQHKLNKAITLRAKF